VESEVEIELPSPDERERLLDALARLVRQRGVAQLVAHPVLLPEAEYFPDDWQDGPEGVVILLRRLLHYAGLGDHHIHLSVYENMEHATYDTHGVGHGAAGAAAWFAGIQGEVCHFGVERRELRDVEELVGTLGHEVAHAYRAKHELVVTDQRVEEQLTDLTAVYLGFGVFLLNSSSSFKTGGYSASGDRLLWEKRARGYLSPARIAFLLGAQSVVRDAPAKERKRIAATLAVNHRKLYLDACALLGEETDALRGRLEVPEPEDWPRPPSLKRLVPPVTVEEEDRIIDVESARAPRKRAPTATRVVSHHAKLLAVVGATVPFVLAYFELFEGVTLLAASGAGAVLGWGLGRAWHSSHCSACEEPVDRDATRCTSCAVVFESADVPEEDEEGEESEEYDWHADESVPERDRAQARLLSAMFLAWAVERDLVSTKFREEHAELIQGIDEGRPDSHGLYAAWVADKKPFNERGDAFAEHYLGADGEWPAGDYAALMTAELRDSKAAYGRVAVMLDRRLSELEADEA
jgi:hypothetical protein